MIKEIKKLEIEKLRNKKIVRKVREVAS